MKFYLLSPNKEKEEICIIGFSIEELHFGIYVKIRGE